MTIFNEADKVVGRLQSLKGGVAKTTTKSLTVRDFSDLDLDGRRTFRLVVIGPGDTVTLHRSSRTLSSYER